MTATDLIPTSAVVDAVPMMDADEARAYLEMMRNDIATVDGAIGNFRARALDFKEREGWRALGYAGYIEAIQVELGAQFSKSYLSRLLKAAEIERVLELPIGNSVPESQLRPLSDLDTPDQQRQAWQQARVATGGAPTAKAVQRAVDQIKPAPAAPFWQTIDAHHPTAHLWTHERPDLWRSACGIVRQNRGPQGSTEAGHCSSCWRATELKQQKPPAPTAGTTATGSAGQLPEASAELRQLITDRDHLYYGPISVLGELRYTIAHKDYPDRLRSLTEAEIRAGWAAPSLIVPQRDDPHQADPKEPPPVQQLPADIAARVATLGLSVLWRADGFVLHWPEENTDAYASQTPAMAREWLVEDAPKHALERLDKTIPPDLQKAGYYWYSADPPTIRHTDGWSGDAPTVERALMQARERMAARRQVAERAADDGSTLRERAVAALRELEACVSALKAEDLEGLSQAIADLNECEEGTEARHWIVVGWALLDLEAA